MHLLPLKYHNLVCMQINNFVNYSTFFDLFSFVKSKRKEEITDKCFFKWFIRSRELF